MSKNSKLVFIFLQVIAWIIFVGLCIEAGALIVNFIFSIVRPESVKHLYEKLDLSELYARSKWAFFSMYSFILAIATLKAAMFYVVIMLLTKLDLAKPFNSYVSAQITLISYYTLSVGLISYLARESSRQLERHGIVTDNLDRFWDDSQAYILMAAVIYIIAAIISKGVEIQNENDLTV